MLAKVKSCAVVGIEASMVEVEVDLAPGTCIYAVARQRIRRRIFAHIYEPRAAQPKLSDRKVQDEVERRRLGRYPNQITPRQADLREERSQ